VINKINDENIKYALYAGCYISVLTWSRKVKDIDFLVSYKDMEKLKRLFPFAETKDYWDCLLLYLWNNNIVEFMSYPEKNINNSNYYLCLTDLAWKNITKINCDWLTINMLNPVDTILQKAVLQRWIEKWKYDIQDIKSIVKVVDIDINYLNKRKLEFDNQKKIAQILLELNIL
jgi:hypothetical protein